MVFVLVLALDQIEVALLAGSAVVLTDYRQPPLHRLLLPLAHAGIVHVEVLHLVEGTASLHEPVEICLFPESKPR